MKRKEIKRLSKLLESAKLSAKQVWKIRDFINDVDDRAFAQGYGHAIDVLITKGGYIART